MKSAQMQSTYIMFRMGNVLSVKVTWLMYLPHT